MGVKFLNIYFRTGSAEARQVIRNNEFFTQNEKRGRVCVYFFAIIDIYSNY